jgi:SAM-dependent methyltransferase
MSSQKYKILQWKESLSNSSLAHWSDEKVGGVFNNILQDKFEELEAHIKEEGFIEDLENCIHWLRRSGRNISGVGIDLACGTMWLTSYILGKYERDISSFYAADFSEKNIVSIGPRTLEHYNINPEKIYLCLGSFYEIDLPDNSVDFVVMAQAFHHAEYPEKLLHEIKRVLKRQGFVIMIGELYIPILRYAKCYLNFVISKIVSWGRFPTIIKFDCLKKFKKNGLDIGFHEFYFPSDLGLGDHYHLKFSYEKFFNASGFNFKNIKSKNNVTLSYVLFIK